MWTELSRLRGHVAPAWTCVPVVLALEEQRGQGGWRVSGTAREPGERGQAG